MTIQAYGLYTLSDYVTQHTQAGEAVMFVDTIPNPAYPMLPALNRRSASRYAVAHPFPIAFYAYDGPAMTDQTHVVPLYMQEYIDSLRKDMAIHQPNLVIMRSGNCGACSQAYPNIYDYLDARGILAEVIEPDYDLLAVDNGFHIYLRKDTPVP
ncbi:MAG: hypothetical protein MUF38_15850 [Anaerolineae bacterium]|nr:hypothetical protein [Anaerolineae bacterium]